MCTHFSISYFIIIILRAHEVFKHTRAILPFQSFILNVKFIEVTGNTAKKKQLTTTPSSEHHIIKCMLRNSIIIYEGPFTLCIIIFNCAQFCSWSTGQLVHLLLLPLVEHTFYSAFAIMYIVHTIHNNKTGIFKVNGNQNLHPENDCMADVAIR